MVIARAMEIIVFFIQSVFDEFQTAHGLLRLEDGYIKSLCQIVQVQVIVIEVSVEVNLLTHEIEN